MYLVVGLGNPGQKYEKHRHNVGFMTVEHLARTHGMADFKEKFSGVWTKGELTAFGARQPVALLQPGTFMNLSGDCVQPAAAFLKVEPAQLIVVHDELDLPWQDVRLKVGGGHAGHNGLRSIIGRLGTPEFVRVRVGIGRPPPGFAGDVAGSDATLEAMHTRFGDRCVSPYVLAIVAARCGRQDRALSLLATAIDMRDPNVMMLGTDPSFADLAGRPEWTGLLASRQPRPLL